MSLITSSTDLWAWYLASDNLPRNRGHKVELFIDIEPNMGDQAFAIDR